MKLLPEDLQEEIIRRRIICEGCPFNSKNAGNYKTDRVDDHCILCSCNISIKTASMQSNCGIEHWNKEHPEEKMELKWKSYKKTN